jgi:quercetin 2,3-dioxygenase
MSSRKVIKKTYGQQIQMGSLKVRQPLPASGLDQVSPFILLHHAGPTVHAAGEAKSRLSPHPHRGFEPVTFLFSGKLHHKDSLGNEGFLNSGDVQWMTAGSGILHSEGPSEDFAKEGGTFELIQLWVNLPRDNKMTPPKYQDIKKESIPVIKQDNDKVEIKLVAGNYNNNKGPASTFTNIIAMMIAFEEDASTTFDIPKEMNALLYVLDGEVTTGDEEVSKYNLVQYDNSFDTIDLSSKTKGKALLLAGIPIIEPISTYGPFVMNYPGEIKQAILDYENGKMGSLES